MPLQKIRRFLPKQSLSKSSRSLFLLLILSIFVCNCAGGKVAKSSKENQKEQKTQKNSDKEAQDKKDIKKNDAKAAEASEANFLEANEPKPILITGNQRVEESVILSYFVPADFIKDQNQAVSRTTKKLLENEWFKSVKISVKTLENGRNSGKFSKKQSQKNLLTQENREEFLWQKWSRNKQLIVEIEENPIILEVKFVGNKKINDEALQSEITLKKRAIFSRQKLQADLKRIGEIYTKTGRFLTKIDPKIIEKDQNRIELIFDITEGPKAKIGEIFFLGNKFFDDQELRDEISTKKSRWWKFLSSSDSYDSDRIEFDKETLRRHYGKNGFADFAVISAVAQINRQKDKFFVSFMLEEGIRYKIGEIKLESYVKKLDPEILRKKILIKSGKIYNSELVEKSVDEMVDLLSDRAYAFANVEPVLKRDREKRIIDIDFVIRETPRIYLNQIKISGNIRTKDEVIRREIRLKEGDPYNITRINRSKQRIENLGFFEKVEFKTKRLGDSDKVDLEIEVKEKKTGELNLGVGYSTVSRFNVNAGIRENNLFGTGRSLGFNAQKAFAFTSLDLSYTKPYLLGMPIDGGFDVFQVSQLARNGLPYDSRRVGFSLNAGYRITEFLSHNLSYNYVEDRIYNPSPYSSSITLNLLGQYLTSGVGQSFLYDKRDNRFDPRKGFFIMASQNYNGFGGDIKTIKNEGTIGLYQPIINRDFVAKLSVKGGAIDGLGQDLRSNYGFFADGNNFRGFAFGGTGPRAYINGQPGRGGAIIGSKVFYIGTAEMRFPLGLPKELGIYGVLFSDNGVFKGVDRGILNDTQIADSNKIRSTYGFSLAWASPMGPIRLDFARIYRSEPYDVPLNFNFSVGSSF